MVYYFGRMVRYNIAVCHVEMLNSLNICWFFGKKNVALL